MELQALTGQLYIVNGETQPAGTAPGLLAQPAPSTADRSRQRDFLFAHLTLSGPPDETENLAQDLLDAVSATFYGSSGSVTSALRKALLQANQLLFRYNMSGAGPSRNGALTCAARRGQDLFMVQSGEGFAMLGRPFGVERLPTQQPERTTPLGRTSGLDIRFFHNVLEPGDMLLLADPRLAHLTAQTMEAVLVDSDVERSLLTLGEVIGPGTGRVLLVEFTDDPLDDMPDTMPEVTRAAPGSARRGHSVPAADVERNVRRGAAQTARGLSRASDGLADVMTRLRPARDGSGDDEDGGWFMPLLLAVLIPVIIGAVVAGVYLRRDIVRQTAAIELSMSENLSTGEAAERDGRPEEARVAFAEVLRLAGEAETSLGTLSEFMRGMRGQAQLALDGLDNISRLTTRPLYTFEDETVRADRIALRDGFDGDFYVLDRTNNRVLGFDTDELYLNLLAPEPQTIFRGGDAVGGHVVARMVDLIWRPAGRVMGDARLAILDAGGAILTWDPTENRGQPIAVDLASEWQGPVALTTYNERLYVLDRTGSQLWRYFPDVNRYVLQEGNRTLTFRDDGNLANAIDFDINNEDAKVVIAYADGDLRYYDSNSGLLLWSSTDLSSRGLATPLVNPVSVKIVGRGVGSSIFVADEGTGRIVQFSQGGEVLAQYKATDENGGELFGALGDFAVALNPLRILLPAGNVIYLATQ